MILPLPTGRALLAYRTLRAFRSGAESARIADELQRADALPFPHITRVRALCDLGWTIEYAEACLRAWGYPSKRRASAGRRA